MFNTPILFVVFNRFDTAKKVFKSIKDVKPSKLFISSDGPRKNVDNELFKVNQIRQYIIDNIDWECDIHTKFNKENVGCSLGVKTAIDWVFKTEDRCIILEDDTLPDASFYHYCEILLKKYEYDYRIGMISGNNHIGVKSKDSSYIFSKFKFSWGWATWKRAWAYMDHDMKFLEKYKNSVIKNMGYSSKSIEHWNKIVDDIEQKIVSAWDYQWFLSLSAQNQLCIFPEQNLVSNIGFGSDATHSTGKADKRYTSYGSIIFPLKHPEYCVPEESFEKIYEKEMIYTLPLWKKVVFFILPKELKSSLKKLLKR